MKFSESEKEIAKNDAFESGTRRINLRNRQQVYVHYWYSLVFSLTIFDTDIFTFNA